MSKVYIFDGVLREAHTKEYWCVRLVEENNEKIDGSTPILYDTLESLLDFLCSEGGRSDVRDWLNEGLTVIVGEKVSLSEGY